MAKVAKKHSRLSKFCHYQLSNEVELALTNCHTDTSRKISRKTANIWQDAIPFVAAAAMALSKFVAILSEVTPAAEQKQSQLPFWLTFDFGLCCCYLFDIPIHSKWPNFSYEH